MRQVISCKFCSSGNVLPRENFDFHRVCERHSFLRRFFLHEIAKKKYNLSPQYLFKVFFCEFCHSPLNEEEINSITENHFHVTCSRHRYMGETFIIKEK